MRILLFNLVGFLFIVSACNKTISSGEDKMQPFSEGDNLSNTAGRSTVYIIYGGDNYCTPNPFVLSSKVKIAFTALFDSSCIYSTVNPGNRNDVNKLYGFSDCGTHHLENSARIGWRWSKDSLRLFGYVHNNNDILIKEITTADIGSILTCRIACLADSYSFDVNGKTVSLPRHCSGKYTRYKLFPYFGGDETAPHDIKIIIQEIPY